MVDTTDAVLELEDYIAIEKRKLSNDLEWASLLTERMFEPSGGRLLRQAYVEWKLGNLSNAGVALIRILEEHLKEVAQSEYETYELGVPND